MKNRIKLNAVALIGALLLCALFPHLWIRRATGKLDDILEIVGFALMLLGFLVRVSARGYKAAHSSNGNQLVTGGPYSLVRNPMYLGIIISGTGVVMTIGQWWALIFFIGGFLLRYLCLFKKEEQTLTTMFGQTYREYAKSVPRIMPNLRTIFKREIREYLPLKKEWIRPEMISVIPVVVLVIGVEWWESFIEGRRLEIVQDTLRFFAVTVAFIILGTYLTGTHAKVSRTDSRNQQ